MKPKQTVLADLPYLPNEFVALRIQAAIENGSNKNLCFSVGGGIGDRLCAEPTLRFALENFKDVSISIICETPELFSHLKFHEVFDLKKTYPVVGRHLYLTTYPKSPLYNTFVNANMVDLVDHASISALRCQLPTIYKIIQNDPQIEDRVRLAKLADIILDERTVLVHPGKSWPSRTFPVSFWNSVICELVDGGFKPTIIGNNLVGGDEATEALRLNHPSITDLRSQTSLTELAWLCKHAKAIVTNDSSPLHLAATGEGKIAYIATCRRGDLLRHERVGGKGWRMKDFAAQPMWMYYNMIPNNADEQRISEVPPGFKIEDFLPEPADIVDWIKEIVL